VPALTVQDSVPLPVPSIHTYSAGLFVPLPLPHPIVQYPDIPFGSPPLLQLPYLPIAPFYATAPHTFIHCTRRCRALLWFLAALGSTRLLPYLGHFPYYTFASYLNYHLGDASAWTFILITFCSSFGRPACLALPHPPSTQHPPHFPPPPPSQPFDDCPLYTHCNTPHTTFPLKLPPYYCSYYSGWTP